VNRFSNRPIVVVGAGGVGCATAYFLAEAGHRVKLLDSADQCASGASGANGAQLSYSFVEPLATPSLLPKIPGILFGRDPALKVCLKASLSQWRWGVSVSRRVQRRRGLGDNEIAASTCGNESS
jgi:D-amino-acid dehydrogenase